MVTKRSSKMTLAMLSVLLFSTLLLSSFTVTPCEAVDYTKVGVKVGDWAYYSASTNSTGPLSPTFNVNFTVMYIDRSNVMGMFYFYYSNGTLAYSSGMGGNISSGVSFPPTEPFLFLMVPNLAKDDPIYIGSPIYVNDTGTMVSCGKTRTYAHINATFTSLFGDIPVDLRTDQATGIGIYINSIKPDGPGHSYTTYILTSTSLWAPPDYTKVGVKVGDWAYYSGTTNMTGGIPPEFNINFTITNIDRSNVTGTFAVYYTNGTLVFSQTIWGNITSGDHGPPSAIPFPWLLVVPDLTMGDPIWLNSPYTINDTGIMVAGDRARPYAHINVTISGGFQDFHADQATGIVMQVNVLTFDGTIYTRSRWNLISTSLWSPPDYTKVGVKVGDWVFFSVKSNQTGMETATSANLTIVAIDRLNVTFTITVYNASGPILVQTIWGNLSDGTCGPPGQPPIYWWLIASSIVKYDPLYHGSSLWINETFRTAIFGKFRECNYLHTNVAYLPTPLPGSMDLYWDKATGTTVKADIFINFAVVWHIQWNLTSTSLWSSADYSRVGVKVGDWAYYLNEPPGNPNTPTSINITILNIDRCNLTASVTSYYANGTIVTMIGWFNVSDGTGLSPGGLPPLIASNLTQDCPLFIGAPLWINETVSMVVFGESRECNHIDVSNYMGIPDVHMGAYWDKPTGILVKLEATYQGSVITATTLMSTSLWTPPPPTIDQPAEVTYTYGTTGHSITWNPSSTIPKNYTITFDGAAVSFGTWSGEALTQNVDGLGIGTYEYNCTVYDTIGRHVSSVVTVTVNAPPAPTIDQPANVTYTYSTTGHSITWNPSSTIPKNCTITMDGEPVASGLWHGEAISWNVDGLGVGTYVYECTVFDTLDRKISSSVTVTVNAPALTIDQPADITYTYGTTGHSITWNPSSIIPKNYTIISNGLIVQDGDWTGNPITCSVDWLDLGLPHVFNCTVFDTLGQHVSSIVTVTVGAPAPTISQPADITYVYSTTSHRISWIGSSIIPKNYTITRNGTQVKSANWFGEEIVQSVDGLEIGTYVFNCTVYDLLGRPVSDVVTVRVNAPRVPTIDQPTDITYTAGTTGHGITWQPSCDLPKNYTITRNGTQVSSGAWQGQIISFNVDGLEAGTYVFNCTVYDTFGQHASDVVTVTVSGAPTAQPFPVELLIAGVAGVIAIVVIVIAVFVLRKRGR